MLITFDKKLHHHVIIAIAYLLFAQGIIEAKGNTNEVNDSSRSKYYLKLNLNFDGSDLYISHWTFLRGISPSFLIRTKRDNLFEFALLDLTVGAAREDSGQTWNDLVDFGNFGLKFQFNYRFIKRQIRIEPYLGTAVAVYYFYSRNRPYTNNYSNSTHNRFNAVLNLAPAIRWNISPRVFLNLEAQIPVLSFSSFKSQYSDSSLPPYGANISSNFFESLNFDYGYFSFGLGVNI